MDRPIAARRQRDEDHRRIAAVMRDAAAAAAGIDDPGTFPVVRIPQNRNTSTPLAAERVEHLRRNLTRVATRAFDLRAGIDTPDPEPQFYRKYLEPPEPDMDNVLRAACTSCRGNCCKTGGEHAYITHRTILHYLESHSGETLEEVIGHYMEHLPSEVLEGGCVYQHPERCALPHDMRSITCNRFYCDPLYTLRVNRRDGEPARAFIVDEGDLSVPWGIFATATETTVVYQPEAIAATGDHDIADRPDLTDQTDQA